MKFQASGKGDSIGNLIKLKSGESVTGVLRGDPYEFESAFKAGDKPKFRFRINLVVSEGNTLTAKVLEGGYKIYSQLRDFQAAGWNLEKSYTKISRQGSTMNDTVWSATILPTPVSEATLANIEKVRLNSLGSAPAEPSNDFQAMKDSDLPF